jgi:Tetratricopeptide repeat
MSNKRVAACFAFLILVTTTVVLAQAPPASKPKPGGTDMQLCERVLAARKEYQDSLEALRTHYVSTNKIEHARWAEDELLQFHRMNKQAYNLALDVGPPNLQALYNIPEANELVRRALTYKDKGWGTDYTDNQRRAELLLQQVLTKHPQSDKISDAAYYLGDLYESRAYRHLERAALYFERCFNWNPKTHFDARLRAAQLYERLGETSKATEIYTEIPNRETDQKRIDYAQKKIAELNRNRASKTP